MVILRDGNAAGQGFRPGLSFLLTSLHPPSPRDFSERTAFVASYPAKSRTRNHDSVDKASCRFFHLKQTHIYVCSLRLDVINIDIAFCAPCTTVRAVIIAQFHRGIGSFAIIIFCGYRGNQWKRRRVLNSPEFILYSTNSFLYASPTRLTFARLQRDCSRYLIIFIPLHYANESSLEDVHLYHTWNTSVDINVITLYCAQDKLKFLAGTARI